MSVAVFRASFWSHTNFLFRDNAWLRYDFHDLGAVLATEPTLLNRLCFIRYVRSAFHIIGAYSAKMDMSTPALWCEFDAFGQSYVPLIRSSTFSEIVFEPLWLPYQW